MQRDSDIKEDRGDIYDRLMGGQILVISAIVSILVGAYFGGKLLAYLGV